MIKPKRQNAVFISGWIISANWMEYEEFGGEQVLVCTIRSDREKYGGHHTVYFRGNTATRLYVALSVFNATAKRNTYAELEKIPFEKMDDHFLMVVIHGVLHFDNVFAVYLSCLNLTGGQRVRVDDLLVDMQRRSLGS